MVCLQHSSFLPGPDLSISCSTSKSGAQPHRVTSVLQALFLLCPPGPLPAPTSPWGVCPPSFPHLAQVHEGIHSVLGPRDERTGFCSSDSESEPESVFLLLRNPCWVLKHVFCLSYFLWLGNSAGGGWGGGVGSRQGGEATSRRQRGRRGQGWSCAGDTGQALAWERRGEEGC